MKRKKKEALRGEAAPTIGIMSLVVLGRRCSCRPEACRRWRRPSAARDEVPGHVSAYGGARHHGERGGAARRHGGCGAPAWRRGGLHVMRRLTARGGGHWRRGAAGGQLRCDAARLRRRGDRRRKGVVHIKRRPRRDAAAPRRLRCDAARRRRWCDAATRRRRCDAARCGGGAMPSGASNGSVMLPREDDGEMPFQEDGSEMLLRRCTAARGRHEDQRKASRR